MNLINSRTFLKSNEKKKPENEKIKKWNFELDIDYERKRMRLVKKNWSKNISKK